MPDLTMCASHCPLSGECYRHQRSGTKPSARQSYASFDGGADCDHYVPVAWEPKGKAARDQLARLRREVKP